MSPDVSRHPSRRATRGGSFFCFVVLVSCIGVGPGLARSETHPIWSPGLEQAVVGPFGRGKPPESIGALVALVAPYLHLSEGALARQVGSLPGGAPDEAGIRELAAATYNLALLYHLTGERDYGARSARLLHAYADRFPSWQYRVCRGKCGIWTGWYHADMDVSRLLALAFDLVAPGGLFFDIGPKAKEDVRRLLVSIVRADLEYPMYTINWAFMRPVGLVIFGRVLDDPELTHLGYWFLSKIVHELYAADGFIAEGTYSYHAQMTEPILDADQAFYFDGYSDPEGYRHVPFERRWDPVTIDDYSLEKEHGKALRRMATSLRETALPDGEWPVLNETKHYGEQRGLAASRSVMLGGIGHAILARGRNERAAQARLDFSPSISHHHRDALNLIYFDRGTETLGGTAYRRPDREWNRSTLAQNLVTVDSREQKGAYFVDWTMSPYMPGRPGRTPVIRQRWSEEDANLHNNVRLWFAGRNDFTSVQVVEVDARDAYRDSTETYLRTLVMVASPDGGTYLIDVFRVRGGSTLDWRLHGGYDEYGLSVDSEMHPAGATAGPMRILSRSVSDGDWRARFTYQGGIRHVVTMLGRMGTVLFGADGPRFEVGGRQPYLLARRSKGTEEEEVFAAIHEVVGGDESVTEVSAFDLPGGDSSTVGIRIDHGAGIVDYFVHSLSTGTKKIRDSRTRVDFESDARAIHMRTRSGKKDWAVLVEGTRARMADELLEVPEKRARLGGTVVSVARRAAGAENDAFLAAEPVEHPERLAGRTLHVSWGNGWVWPYTIESVHGREIRVREEPGFEIDEHGVDMQFFPVQELLGLGRYPAPVRFDIPVVTVWGRDQDVSAIAIDASHLDHQQNTEVREE